MSHEADIKQLDIRIKPRMHIATLSGGRRQLVFEGRVRIDLETEWSNRFQELTQLKQVIDDELEQCRHHCKTVVQQHLQRYHRPVEKQTQVELPDSWGVDWGSKEGDRTVRREHRLVTPWTFSEAFNYVKAYFPRGEWVTCGLGPTYTFVTDDHKRVNVCFPTHQNDQAKRNPPMDGEHGKEGIDS